MMLADRNRYPKIAIIIPVFNRVEYTIECLESLGKVEYPNYGIILIDDGSTDMTCETIRKRFPDVMMIMGNGNLWWAKATNLGIRKAIGCGFDYVLFLNNDDEVDKHILGHLTDCAHDNPNSLVAAKVLDHNHPENIVFAGGYVDWKTRGTYRIGAGEADKGQYDQRRDIEWIPGAGTFVNTTYFNKVGLVDAKVFPQYGADIDFTLRARKVGYRIVFEPKAVIWKKLESTGIFTPQNEKSFRIFLDAFLSLRSPVNIKRQIRLLWRHCPRRYILKRLSSTYCGVYRFLFAQLIKHRFPFVWELKKRYFNKPFTTSLK